jgi:hypothetical protein
MAKKPKYKVDSVVEIPAPPAICKKCKCNRDWRHFRYFEISRRWTKWCEQCRIDSALQQAERITWLCDAERKERRREASKKYRTHNPDAQRAYVRRSNKATPAERKAEYARRSVEKMKAEGTYAAHLQRKADSKRRAYQRQREEGF